MAKKAEKPTTGDPGPTSPVPNPPDPPGVQNGVLTDPQMYIWDLLRRSPGQGAADWVSVMERSGLPPGNPPNIKPRNNGFYGITQQIGAGGPRGQIFLPTAEPDALGYYAHPINLLNNSGGDCSTNSTFCVWDWRDNGAPPPYVPIGMDEPLPPSEGGTTPPPASGVSKEEVQAMIDAAVANCLKVDDSLALVSSGDEAAGVPQSYLTAEGGGPKESGQPFVLTSRDASEPPAAWQSWKIKKGE